MNAVQSLWLVFTLVTSSAASGSTPVDCCPEVCLFDDVDCLTPGGADVYKSIVCGIEDPCTRMDPLRIPNIRRPDGSKTYNLTNIQVTGLCGCIVKKALLYSNDQKYQQHLSCPKLSITYELQINDGRCGKPVHVKVSVTISHYEIKNSGTYGIFISKGDNLPHFYIQDVCTTVKLVGYIKYHVSATCCSSPITVNRPKEKISNDIKIIIKKAMELLWIAIDKYDKIHSLGHIFPASNAKP